MHTIRNKPEILSHQNELVELEGIYVQNDLRMRKKDPEVLHEGYVAIRLGDGTDVFLFPPSHPEAVRNPDEIAEWENRKVKVKCRILPAVPQPADTTQEAGMISAPCIMELVSISAAG